MKQKSFKMNKTNKTKNIFTDIYYLNFQTASQ